MIYVPNSTVQPQQQLSNSGDHADITPVAQYHPKDAHLLSLPPSTRANSANWHDVHAGSTQQSQPLAAPELHAADWAAMQHDLHPPDEQLSPRTLAAILHMPAISFDSSQRTYEHDLSEETSQPHQPRAAGFDHHSLDQLPLPDISNAGSQLQTYQSFPLANPVSDLQWAGSCPVPVHLPNVIRKTSSDSTIE